MAYSLTGAQDLIRLYIRQDQDIDSDDAENAEWQDRGLSNLVRVVNDLYNFEGGADWDFRYRIGVAASVAAVTTTPNPVSDSKVATPADFQRLGDRGVMVVKDQKLPIRYKDPADLMRMRLLEGARAQYPEFFTIADWDTGTPADNGFIFFYPFNTQAFVPQMGYEPRAPTLTYANPGGLQAIPKRLWETVLLPALEDLGAAKGGDGRSLSQYSPRAARALADAYVAARHGQERNQIAGGRGLQRFRMHVLAALALGNLFTR